jgi:hypothetical protein
MPGRGFLDLAKEIVAGATEYHWRGAAVHAYYALFLECRDSLERWGFAIPRGVNVHAHVRLRLTYAADADLKQLGRTLDRLVQLRNQASYDLSALWQFSDSAEAQQAIQNSADGLVLLDPIEADPARLAAAKAAIGP